jgi:hypothetical protein
VVASCSNSIKGEIEMSNKEKPETIVRYRDSKTGEFVKKPYADRHPATTEREHIRKPTSGNRSYGKR